MTKSTQAVTLVRRLSGRLANGAERGKGSVYHAVTSTSEWTTAICGAKPGRRSGAGFIEPVDTAQTVTCTRCLAKLSRRTPPQDRDYSHLKGKFIVNDGGAFLTQAGTWTNEPEEAATFDTFQDALVAAHAVTSEKLTSANVFGPLQ